MAAQPDPYPYNVVINHIKNQKVYGFLKNNTPVVKIQEQPKILKQQKMQIIKLLSLQYTHH